MIFREFVQLFRAYMPDDLTDADANHLRIRLEVSLKSAYRRSFAHGEAFVCMQIDEAFEQFVKQYEVMFNRGHGDGGLHDRGLPQPKMRMRGGAMVSRSMTANA